jgi:transposase
MARAYSLDFRERAVGYVLDGGGKEEACRIFKIARDTLYRWLRQYEQTGSLESKPLGSRPWKLDHQAILEYIKSNNDSTLAEYAAQFKTSPSVIDYILRKHKITRKKNHALRGTGRRKTRSISG